MSNEKITVDNFEDLVKFSMNFIQPLLSNEVVHLVKNEAETVVDKHGIEQWLLLVRDNLTRAQYDAMRRHFVQFTEVSTKNITNKKAKFWIDSIKVKRLLTSQETIPFVKHAETVATNGFGLDNLMCHLRHAIGAKEHKSLVVEYSDFCKIDCGFERLTTGEASKLLERFKTLV